MLRPKIHIRVGNIEFDYVTSYQGGDSWEELTETFKISIPNKARFKGKAIINNKTEAGESVFKRGDAVQVTGGYFPNSKVIFNGYLTRVVPNSPLILECEDAMYILKQTSHTISFKQQKLSVLMETITKDENGQQIVPFKAIDTTLGPFRISNASTAQILDKLKGDPYGFFSYMKDGVLNVGLAYDAGQGKEFNFDFERNIISDSLEYMRDDDVKVAIKAVSIDRENKKKESYVYFGGLQYVAGSGEAVVGTTAPANSDIRTLYFYNTPQADIIAAAKRKLTEIIYEGYRGSFVTFGEPVVKHGDKVILKSRKFPERDGKYIVKGVENSGGVGGNRQTIELDVKVA